MNLYTKLIAGVVFPAQERLKKHNTVTVRRVLEKTQWWDAGKLRDLQLARLRNLLQHAAKDSRRCSSAPLLVRISSFLPGRSEPPCLTGRHPPAAPPA